MATDSNVSQARAMGGWVKAMVYINNSASGGVAIVSLLQQPDRRIFRVHRPLWHEPYCQPFRLCC